MSACYAQLPVNSYIVDSPMTTFAVDIGDPSTPTYSIGEGGVIQRDQPNSPATTGAPDSGFLTQPTPAQRRERFLQAAQRWAVRAGEHAAEASKKRTAECDAACAVSLCNLGDIARLIGDDQDALSKYKTAIAMSKRVGFASGVEHGQAGLKLLHAKGGEKKTGTEGKDQREEPAA